ncbi:MAG: hypothetical protein ACYTEP_10125 [Planctomycetota bacterium]|jgi:hypothetical protein
MPQDHRNRGIVAPALLLIAAAGFAGFTQGQRSGSSVRQEPENILPDPAAQRRDMIAVLQKMELHLASMEKTLQGIERIEGAQLRLQFDAQKAEKPVAAGDKGD